MPHQDFMEVKISLDEARNLHPAVRGPWLNDCRDKAVMGNKPSNMNSFFSCASIS